MILTHRIQLDPTFAQRSYFARAAGTARFVWNIALAEWDRQYEAGEKPNWRDLQKQFNATKHDLFPWMKAIHRECQSRPFSNLGTAFKSFFSGKAKHPAFKKKGRTKDSFYVSNDRLRVCDKAVIIPRLGRVRMTQNLRLSGYILSATIGRTADKWFISIKVDVG